jgi:hypothetical protein
LAGFNAHLAATSKRPIDQGRREDVEAWIALLLGRWKPSTAHNRYRWLEEEDISSPMAKMKPPAVPDRPVPVLSEPQLCTLFAVWALDRYLRAGSRHRLAHLDALWLGLRGPLTISGLQDLLDRRARQAGIPALHPHMFRHTFAHDWLGAGGTETNLMRIAGWRSRDMLARNGASAADAGPARPTVASRPTIGCRAGFRPRPIWYSVWLRVCGAARNGRYPAVHGWPSSGRRQDSGPGRFVLSLAGHIPTPAMSPGLRPSATGRPSSCSVVVAHRVVELEQQPVQGCLLVGVEAGEHLPFEVLAVAAKPL